MKIDLKLVGSEMRHKLEFGFLMHHRTILGAEINSAMLAIKKNPSSSSSSKWDPSLSSGSSCPTKLFSTPRVAQQHVQKFKFKLGSIMGPKLEFLMHY